jgi:hypothetical protein
LIIFEFDSESANPELYAERDSTKPATGDSKTTAVLSDDQIVLRFLRDATYYFLTNKDYHSKDSRDHLFTIMSLLRFSQRQQQQVLRTKGIS